MGCDGSGLSQTTPGAAGRGREHGGQPQVREVAPEQQHRRKVLKKTETASPLKRNLLEPVTAFVVSAFCLGNSSEISKNIIMRLCLYN